MVALASSDGTNKTLLPYTRWRDSVWKSMLNKKRRHYGDGDEDHDGDDDGKDDGHGHDEEEDVGDNAQGKAML